jgi:hypothetical protein
MSRDEQRKQAGQRRRDRIGRIAFSVVVWAILITHIWIGTRP